MLKSFIYQNERINKEEFLVEIGPSNYVEFEYSVTFYAITKGKKQQISTYYLKTLTEDGYSYDLNLHGGVPEWTIENDAIRTVQKLWGHLS